MIKYEDIKKVVEEFKAINGNANIPNKDLILLLLKEFSDFKKDVKDDFKEMYSNMVTKGWHRITLIALFMMIMALATKVAFF